MDRSRCRRTRSALSGSTNEKGELRMNAKPESPMPNQSDIKLEQMRAWVAQLNEAADAYYNGRGELMTDFEWDALFDQLKALEGIRLV